jgi:hypothetical protein
MRNESIEAILHGIAQMMSSDRARHQRAIAAIQADLNAIKAAVGAAEKKRPKRNGHAEADKFNLVIS